MAVIVVFEALVEGFCVFLSGLYAQVLEDCRTLGKQVRAVVCALRRGYGRLGRLKGRSKCSKLPCNSSLWMPRCGEQRLSSVLPRSSASHRFSVDSDLLVEFLLLVELILSPLVSHDNEFLEKDFGANQM